MEETVKEEIVKEIVTYLPPVDMKMSESIGALAGALAKAQGAMATGKKAKEGYGYSYMDLAGLIDTLKKPLADNAISYSQGHYVVTKPNGKIYVGTDSIIMHESGEWLKSTLELPLPAMKQLQPAQLVGVVSTYARRYLLQAQVGIASEDDTDGRTK